MHAAPLLLVMVCTVALSMWSISPLHRTCMSLPRQARDRAAICGDTETCVLSFSVYGDHPRYVVGMDRNAALASAVYPGWSVRVYHDKNVSAVHLRRWRQLGAQLYLRNVSQANDGMFWRFQVAEDPQVDRFLVRDADSRLSAREARATALWVASTEPYFIIRDHVGHSDWAMNGGMWGGRTRDPLVPWAKLMRNRAKRQGYLADMVFLQDVVYPLIHNRTFETDSWSCATCQRCLRKWPRAVGMPTHRAGWEHVGGRFDEQERPHEGDVAALLRAPVDYGCIPPRVVLVDGRETDW